MHGWRESCDPHRQKKTFCSVNQICNSTSGTKWKQYRWSGTNVYENFISKEKICWLIDWCDIKSTSPAICGAKVSHRREEVEGLFSTGACCHLPHSFFLCLMCPNGIEIKVCWNWAVLLPLLSKTTHGHIVDYHYFSQMSWKSSSNVVWSAAHHFSRAYSRWRKEKC